MADRHSYVAFYPSDWLGGTARLQRIHRSVYFDICVYNWDKAEAMPVAELEIMLADLDDNGPKIIAQLVRAGKLHQNEDGSVYNVRAIEEAQKSFNAWEKKAAGGRAGGKALAAKMRQKTPEKTKPEASTPKAMPEDTPELPHAEPEPEPELEPDNKREANASVGANSILADSEAEGEGEKKPKLKTENSKTLLDMSEILGAWNQMAGEHGLSKADSLAEYRRRHLRARLKEFPKAKIIEAIGSIPDSAFLMGKRGPMKATFDFLLTPKNLTKLVEGAYHDDGERIGKPSAWR